MRSKVRRQHGKDFGSIIEAQTLDVDQNNNQHDPPTTRKHNSYYDHIRIRPKEVLSGSFSDPDTSFDQQQEQRESAHIDMGNGDPGPGAIWSMKFSQDGRYMAAGGQNCVIRIWKTKECSYSSDSNNTLHHKQQQQQQQQQQQRRSVSNRSEEQQNNELSGHSIHVFEQEPIRVLCGHTADILDLSWSKVK